MVDMKNNKRRLSIDLSIFAPGDCIGSFFSAKSTTTKSPKSFEEPKGVGLGILAAMKDLDQTHDPFLTAKSRRAALLAISPKSNPILILRTRAAASFNSDKFSGSRANFCGEKGSGDLENMELSKEYACVISHIGKNLIRKREYFDSDLVNKSESTTSYWVSSGAFSASSPGQDGVFPVFQTADFLSSCYLCKKKLHGLDIFMYRGEKAFCSAECRYKEISIDEHEEKFGSGVMKSLKYSVSPCSEPTQFLAGVAAA